MIFSLRPFPYPCAVSIKLQPKSSALLRAATDSSSRCVPQLPPMAQAPKPISDTFQPSRPNVRYFIARIFTPFAPGRNTRYHFAPMSRSSPTAGSASADVSPSPMDELFSDRLVAAIEAKGSPICVGIDPIFDMLPDAVAGSAKDRDGNDAEAAIDAIF